MILTEEMIRKLPVYEIPEDYDSMVDEMIEEAIRDFDKVAGEIDKLYSNPQQWLLEIVIPIGLGLTIWYNIRYKEHKVSKPWI